MVSSTAGLAPQSVLPFHHLEGQRMHAGSAEARSNSTVCKRKPRRSQQNDRALRALGCLGLAQRCAQPMRGCTGSYCSAQTNNPSLGSTRPTPQMPRVTEASALIPAVCTCWNSSPHKTNYSARHKAECALPGGWKIMGGAGQRGLPE